MKKSYPKFLLLYIFICSCPNLIGQNITITDTIKHNLSGLYLKSDSSFTVEGEVCGLDSGSIKISSSDNKLSFSVPLRQSKFYFSGFVKTLEQLHFQINGDYYDNTFYLEAGQISIYNLYQHNFTASGTKENDLNNYFHDTLNKKNSERFSQLSNNVNTALKQENLSLYLKLIDSFPVVEKNFFKTVNEALSQKKYGFYLLGCVNYYYVNYGYFSERQAIFDRLPEAIKNSSLGEKALEFLKYTKMKNRLHTNEDPYEFNLKTINNEMLALKRLKGKTIVLDFWASWCLPCIKALPLLKKIQENDVSKNVVYISVSIDKKEKDWSDKDKKLQIPWFSLLADKATIENYHVSAVPNYIVINKEGKIVSEGSSLSTLYTTLKELEK